MKPDDAELIEEVNGALSRLREQRRASIEVVGHYLNSKMAWKVATYKEAVLYRIVALSESLALNWNQQNMLGCCLPARALIETCAVLFEFEYELGKAVVEGDLGFINDLVMNRHFATRDKDWLDAQPQAQAINILTFIDKFDRRLLKGSRKIYDLLSESCHPNYLGHHAMFATLDTKTGTTTYSEAKDIEGSSHSILGCMVLIMLTEKCIDRLEAETPRVADLQRARSIGRHN